MNAENTLQIGLASIDITPPVGVTLVGYRPRVSTGIAHTLRAEALACRAGDTGWILITSDTIGFPREYVAAVRRHIRARAGIPGDAIMVSGTHTHSGPATIMFGSGALTELDCNYLAALQDRLVEVACEAWSKAVPSVFAAAQTSAPELMSNRRVQQEDGTWINEWTDPHGTHPGFIDPAVHLLAVQRGEAGASGLVVNYGCHPVTLGPPSLVISSDYVGYLKDRLEHEGAAERVAFIQAGGANINPRECVTEGERYPREMGERLAAIVQDALTSLKPIQPGTPRFHREPWMIRRTRELDKRKERADSQVGADIPTEIQVLRCGDVAFVGLPGELFSEYNRMLREMSPAPLTLVVSLANDYVGYLPTDEAQKQGAYETTMAPAEGLESLLLQGAAKVFAAVSNEPA